MILCAQEGGLAGEQAPEGAPPVTELPDEEKHIGTKEDGLDEDETLLLATIPKAKLVGITNYGGVRNCE